MVMPNFLLIGAAKAGTTALHGYLSQHPQVYMSPVKEPHFFALEGETVDYRGPGDRAAHHATVTTLEAYQHLFDGVTNEVAIGEASTSYLYIPKAADRIKHHLPDVKLIAILRHPVDRAYASFLHLVRDNHEPLTDFSQAIAAEEQRIQDNWMPLWHYKQRGFYYSQIKRYFDLFDASQIKIYLYEDLSKNSAELSKDIFRFVGVDDTFIPDTSNRPNASGVPKNRALNAFLSSQNPLKTVLRPLIPAKMRQDIRQKNLAKPEIAAEMYEDLLNLYREDICKLQDLIQRDLSGWLKSAPKNLVSKAS
jgi:hypothetical protein